MEFYEKLFQAIKNDNVKEFKDCMVTNYCGSLRLGRFPVLSVMYLYNSRRLLRGYEKKFLKHNSWQDVGEPSEIAAKFRGVAGKCLRLYLTETVSPLEMLLLLDRNTKLKQVFKDARITAPVKQRLKDIYYIRWALNADFVRGKIVLERRPLTRREKWTWVFRATCVVLCLALFASTPFVVNAFAPFITDEFGVLHVSRFGQIDLASNKVYALDKDVAIPEDFYAEELNCQLKGNGHVLTANGNAAFGSFNGSISGLTIETNGTLFGNINGTLSDVVFNTDGSPIADDIKEGAKLDGVTVNAVVDREISEATGFVANKNHGMIQNVVVNVSGSLSAIASEQTGGDAGEEQTEAEPFNCGGIVAHNYMLSDRERHYENVTNCTVNYDNFTLVGQLKADASFGGVVGTNEGIVSSCKTSGVITANTFDVAGICADNKFWIETSENDVDLHQSSNVEGWNPLASGIVLRNYYVVDQSVNRGDIVSVSTISHSSSVGSPSAYATGIVYENIGGQVRYCENYGAISATATAIDADASGICSFSNGYVVYCVNNGEVSAKGESFVQVAGIVGLSYGLVYYCANNGKISSKSGSDTYVGGIVASTCVDILGCVSNGAIEVEGRYSFVGGVLGCAIIFIDAHGPHGGVVLNSVATCDITVKSGVQLDVGGIVGFAQERSSTGDYYTLTAVRNCYFVGKMQVASGANLGAIVGVVGEKTYNASNSAEKDENKNYFENYYATECGLSRAFGGALDATDHCVSVADIGAEIKDLQQILVDAKYIDIIQNATSQPHTHE